MDRQKFFRNAGCALALCALIGTAGCSSDDSGDPNPLTPNITDDAPPLAPTGLSIPKADGKGCSLRWQPNAEVDLAGYLVYVYDPSPFRDQSYVRLQETPVQRNAFVFSPDGGHANEEVYYLRVSAVDSQGHESPLSAPIEAHIGAPNENVEQDPDAGGDDRTGSGAGDDRDRETPGGPGRTPSIEEPEKH